MEILPNIWRIKSILRLFQKTEEERTLPNASYEGSIILIPKLTKTLQEKNTTHQYSWPRLFFLITIQQNTANTIQGDIERITHHGQVRFIAGMQRCFNMLKSINVIHITLTKWKEKNVISTDAEKAFETMSCPFMIKTLNNWE